MVIDLDFFIDVCIISSVKRFKEIRS